MEFSEWIRQNYSSLEELIGLEMLDKLLKEYQKFIENNPSKK